MNFNSEELQEISNINFGIYSAEEIKNMAVCKISSSRFGEDPKKHAEEEGEIYLFDETQTGKSKTDTVYDERMGPLDHKKRCETCELTFYECPGHFGYIELNVPVLHPLPLFLKMTASFLKCICLNTECNRLLITEDQIRLNKFNNFKRETRFQRILEHLEKVEICSHCGNPHPKVSLNLSEAVISLNHKNKSKTGASISMDLTTEDIGDYLSNIPDEDIELLGFDPARVHPRNFVLTNFPVLPTCSRPPVMTEGNICDDDITLQYIEIIKANNHLADRNLPETRRRVYKRSLEFRIKTLMNNSQGKAKHTTNHRPIRCFWSRLSGKEGQVRGNILGKRGNQAARSVIGPGPELRNNEVGIPVHIAQTLTVPEAVTDFNIQHLTDLVESGGANYVIKKDKKTGKERKIDLKWALFHKGTDLMYGDVIHRRGDGGEELRIFVKDRTKVSLVEGDRVERGGSFLEEVKLRQRKRFNLEVGDVVLRHLRNGDIGMLNRQPTLWKGSKRAQKVVVGPYKTIRFNLAITKPMNADFDGDEGNFSVPQSALARAELYELSETGKMLMSAQTSSSSVAIVQDSLLGAYLMTRGLVRISKHEFFGICMKGDEVEGQVVGSVTGWNTQRVLDRLGHIRRVLKSLGRPTVAFSGRGLISLMLPPGFFYENKNGANPEEPVVKIHDGVYISGALDKKVLGTSPNSLIQVLHKEYGARVAINFLDNVQFIVNAWLACQGFSIGLEDCVAAKREEIESIVKEAFFEAENIAETTILPGIREMRISTCLSNARNEGMRVAQKALSKNNNFISTVTSGSKGDWPNLMQITASLGQQMLSGSRVKYSLNHGQRALPHYRWAGLSLEEEYESRGFVTSSFMKGLSPREFIAHSYCAREGIVHTAISTSLSGYNQRKIVNSQEDLQVKYDGTVRNAVDTVFQLSYASDGFNREKMIRVGGELLPVDIGRLVDRLNFQAEKNKTREKKKKVSRPDALKMISFIKPRPGAPEEFSKSLLQLHRTMFLKQLVGREIYPCITEELKGSMERQYFDTLIEPCESVGIQAAQNIGREQTQTALDAFHRAGARENFLVDGNSRFSELLSMSKKPAVTTSTIYFRESNGTIDELRNMIGDGLVEFTFEKIVAKKKIYMSKEEVLEKVPGAAEWYPVFEEIHRAVPKNRGCVVYELDKNVLFQFKFGLEDLCEKIESCAPETVCAWSPLNLGQIHVYFDVENVSSPLDDDEEDPEALFYFIADSSVEGIEPIFICGIRGIDEMFYLQDSEGKWIVETRGTNLMELLAHEKIDETRTLCNNVWDIYQTLGIEATREFLIEEFGKIMSVINLCDIQLLVDTMTYSGTLSSISRHAMKRDQAGSLAKAGFEETLDNFCKAGLYGETDNLQGVSASIICGKLAKIGTGGFDVLYDLEASPAAV